ncbi:DUF3944 domain-containing protein [Helicobacter winghamensis]|uniref:DUF3944 domain-containing protein n=1 Tax=Helicobacter winghamensis TaxID=157268 RepID=UPI00279F3930
MAYRYDVDLEFLRELENEELNGLFDVLTKNKDGNTRFTEVLTNNDLVKYKYPEHKEYIDLILEELQFFGGNSIVNVFRGGKGVLYKEILCDVCNKLKVNYNKKASTQKIEENLFAKILEDYIHNLSPEDMKKIGEEFNVSFNTKSSLTAGLQAIMKAKGFESYKLILIVTNAFWKFIFGTGLPLVANATLAKTLSVFLGPIGWTATGIWTAFDIASPAYRVTIPAVIQVAYLRQLLNQKKSVN